MIKTLKLKFIDPEQIELIANIRNHFCACSSGSGNGGSGNSSSFSISFKGGSGGGGTNRSAGGRGGDETEIELDAFGFGAESHFLTDNPDFSPLTVLDNISLKSDFPYACNATEIDKPPDLIIAQAPTEVGGISAGSGGGGGGGGGIVVSASAPGAFNENLFQFTATVPPVPPDNSKGTGLVDPVNPIRWAQQSSFFLFAFSR